MAQLLSALAVLRVLQVSITNADTIFS